MPERLTITVLINMALHHFRPEEGFLQLVGKRWVRMFITGAPPNTVPIMVDILI